MTRDYDNRMPLPSPPRRFPLFPPAAPFDHRPYSFPHLVSFHLTLSRPHCLPFSCPPLVSLVARVSESYLSCPFSSSSFEERERERAVRLSGTTRALAHYILLYSYGAVVMHSRILGVGIFVRILVTMVFSREAISSTFTRRNVNRRFFSIKKHDSSIDLDKISRI